MRQQERGLILFLVIAVVIGTSVALVTAVFAVLHAALTLMAALMTVPAAAFRTFPDGVRDHLDTP